MVGRGAVIAAVVLASASAHAESRSVSLLPIRSRWASTNEVVRVTDVLGELGGELGLEIIVLGGDPPDCFNDDACYLRVARAAGPLFVLGVDVVKTSSGRLHLTFRIVDTVGGTVRALPLVRSQPGVLRAQLRSTVTAIRDAVPRADLREITRLPPAAPPLPPIPPAPEPPTPAPTPWYQTISINAFASTAYTYNANRPPTATNALRVFDVEHDSLTIDVAELVIQRAAGEPGDAGFRIDLVAGSAIPHLTAASGLFRDTAGVAQDFDLQQGFVSYNAPIGRGLRIDAGKFVTPAGAEVIEGYDGFGDHYSHAYLFGFAIPFTHTGVRLAYSFGDRVSVTALATNGWDVVRDNNRAKSFGAQLTVLPVTDITLSTTYLVGAERPDNSHTLRHLGDVVVSYKPVQRLAFGANVDYGKDGRARWYGAAGYLRLDPAPRISVAARVEGFSDRDGARTGVAQRLWETTLTTSFRFARNLTFRFELRYDHSDQIVFPAAGGDRRFQLTAATNAIYAL